MKAAIYARYSSDKQKDASIADQFYSCERMAERLDFMVVARFEDKAITGTHRMRPGYKLMLDAAQRGDFDVLIVDDLSRLCRDSIEQQQLIREFKYRKQRIIAISDGFDSNDKSYKIQAGVRGIVNDIYIDDLRAKTHRGMSGKARAGKCTGGTVYGYKRQPVYDATKVDEFGRPLVIDVDRVIDPEQARWVKQIFEWYVAGHAPMWIAAKLNELRVPSPRGGTWARSAIYGDNKRKTGLLNNELYIGKSVWNRREWVKTPEGKRRPVERSMNDHVVVERPDLRIIEDSLWQAKCDRQKATSANTRPDSAGAAPATGSKYLFSGLLKCGECGSNYILVGKKYYGCGRNKDRGAHACSNGLTVRKDIVESVLLKGIKEELLSPEATREFLRECNAMIGELEAAFASERRQLETCLRQVETELKNLMGFIKTGVALPSIAEEIQKAEDERRRLELMLKEGQPPSAEIMHILPRALDRYRDMIGQLGNIQPDLIPEAREQLRTLTGGEVRLLPFEGDGLAAEVTGDYCNLMKSSSTVMVAGARNGRFLTRFVLRQPTGKSQITSSNLRLVI